MEVASLHPCTVHQRGEWGKCAKMNVGEAVLIWLDWAKKGICYMLDVKNGGGFLTSEPIVFSKSANLAC